VASQWKELTAEKREQNKRFATAAGRALRILADRHREEFEAIQDEVRAEMDLPPIVRRARKL
jgi:hypothetical protein